jgi:hypothetical protein
VHRTADRSLNGGGPIVSRGSAPEAHAPAMTTTRTASALLAALAVVLGAAACGDDEPAADRTATTTTAPPVIDPGDGGDHRPRIDPADFVERIDHRYLPLLPGARWEYETVTEDGVERNVVEVTDRRKVVMGVSTTVVHDVVTTDGQPVEDTFDWYAQDRDGNVWYFGEAVRNFEDGRFEDTDGSFEAGKDGALPGIVMLADPEPGDAYRQEHLAGEAEDLGEVLRIGDRRGVPAGDFEDVLVTRDWNPLEPAVVEQKSYAPGVGVIFEETVVGGVEHGQLVAFRPGR